VIVTLEGGGFTILEGIPRMKIEGIGGFKAGKVGWLIRSDKPQTLTVKAATRIAGTDTKTVSLGGSR
jgi:hypothetical protein